MESISDYLLSIGFTYDEKTGKFSKHLGYSWQLHEIKATDLCRRSLSAWREKAKSEGWESNVGQNAGDGYGYPLGFI